MASDRERCEMGGKNHQEDECFSGICFSTAMPAAWSLVVINCFIWPTEALSNSQLNASSSSSHCFVFGAALYKKYKAQKKPLQCQVCLRDVGSRREISSSMNERIVCSGRG